MSAGGIDYRGLLRLVLSILAAVLVLAAMQRAVWAEGRTFILPASSGYGASDCVGKALGCSAVIASAWCEAHGYSAPIAYGTAEDMTGIIPGLKPTVQPPKIEPGAFVVTCSE